MIHLILASVLSDSQVHSVDFFFSPVGFLSYCCIFMGSKFFLLKSKYDSYEWLSFGPSYLAQLVFLKVCMYFNVIIFLLKIYPLPEFLPNGLMVYTNILSQVIVFMVW